MGPKHRKGGGSARIMIAAKRVEEVGLGIAGKQSALNE